MEVAFNTTPSIPSIHPKYYYYISLYPLEFPNSFHILIFFSHIIMSTSSEIVDSGRFSGQNRTPEKSNFSHTCNLFSQYLKENAFPDLTLGRRPTSSTATMNLFPMTETPRAAVPQKQQDQSRSMTIFYDGQVIVFNDLTPEKVKEIMKLAENGVTQKPTAVSSASVSTPKSDEPAAKTGPQGGIHLLGPVASDSDLPIARKASLARFLEKRKDRITARSPYQIEGGSKQDDTKSWLGLGAQSEVQFQPRS